MAKKLPKDLQALKEDCMRGLCEESWGVREAQAIAHIRSEFPEKDVRKVLSRIKAIYEVAFEDGYTTSERVHSTVERLKREAERGQAKTC